MKRVACLNIIPSIKQRTVVYLYGDATHNWALTLLLDSAIHWIKIYLVDNAIGFPDTYQLDLVIYLVDSAMQCLNNWGQIDVDFAVLSSLLTFLEENMLYFNYERHGCVFDDVSVWLRVTLELILQWKEEVKLIRALLWVHLESY